MQPVKTRELVMAARVADALVYAAGIAGVVAGGLLLRDGEPGFALVAWVVTFIAGAALRLASWGARALAELLARTARMEDDLARLATQPLERPPGSEPRRGPPDPYRRWGGQH
jgi:hypothetical protein